jgi:cellulose biosynthesis protein BcsQ
VGATLSILNQKGGVGKTTVTLGLASAAAERGDRVLVVDLDTQGSSTWLLGADPAIVATDTVVGSAWSDAIDLISCSGDVGGALAAVDTRRYHAVLVDCPPTLGDRTVEALTASRYAIVVVEPSSLGLRGIGGVADVIDDIWDTRNPDLELAGVILNRVPAVSSEAERRIDELARIVGRKAIWQPPIPQRVIVNQAVGERRPIHSYGARAADPIDAFDRLWGKVRKLSR